MKVSVSRVLLFLAGDLQLHFTELTAREDAGHGKQQRLGHGRR